MSKILVVAAHPDDEILGVGGTVRKQADNGHLVYGLILGEGMTSRLEKGEKINESAIKDLHKDTIKSSKIIGFKAVYFSNFPDNRFDSINLLEIVKEVEKYVTQLKPEIVYTHHYGDLNIDHRITFEAVQTACRPVGNYSVKEIYCFETPSSTEWNFMYGENTFKPNVFIDIEKTVEYKLKAMKCYKSEIRGYPHPRSLEALKINAARWGTVVGKRYVEAFELVRKVE